MSLNVAGIDNFNPSKKAERKKTMKKIAKTSKIFMSGFVLLSLVLVANLDTQAAEPLPVDLNTWTAESYPPLSGFLEAAWAVSTDGNSVLQSINGQPTVFYSDFEVLDTEVEGTIEVITTGDDDFIGFVLGFQPGDTTNPAADYLLVDWKRVEQGYDFPPCTPGSTALAGLAVSRVSGIPTADEFWGHTNFNISGCSDLDNGLEELARGTNLGDTGWADNRAYKFAFEYGATSLKVYVDGNLEIDITGDFSNGRLAFYNFSQAPVDYNSVVVVVGVEIDIKPGSDPNCFNNDGNGVIPVAILGSETFDVNQIDPYSVTLEGMAVKMVGKADRALSHIEDVNDDGFDDLVVQIQDENGIFEPGIGEAIIMGLLEDGRNFEGSDYICVTQ